MKGGSFALMSLALVMVLQGCTTSPASLESRIEPFSRSYEENYQEIYRRISRSAARCWTGMVGAYASMVVDSELYSELGFGELTYSMSNIGIRDYYLTARIEAVEDGSLLTVHSGRGRASEGNLRHILRWADGDESC